MSKERRWANHAAIGFAIAIVAVAGVAGWMYVVEPVVVSGRARLTTTPAHAVIVAVGGNTIRHLGFSGKWEPVDLLRDFADALGYTLRKKR